MKNLTKILGLALALIAALPADAAVAVWEQVRPYSAQADSEAERIDVQVRDGYIYVTTNKPITVKVHSIVGQLISQVNLQPGTSRMRVTVRGIYILKAGDKTIRANV